MQLHPHRQNNGVNNTTWAILVPLGSQHPDKNFMTGPPGCMWVYVIWHCVSWWHITSHSPIQFFKSLTFFFHVLSLDLTIPFFHIHPEESMIGSPHPHPTPPSKMIFFCVLWSSSHLTYFCSPPLPNILCVQTQASNCTDLRCLAIVKKRSTDHALKKI